MYNRCEFIGRLGVDPESKEVSTGKTVAKFRIAVTKKYNGQEQTEWIPVVCWGHNAEFAAKYLTKGALVFVAGEWQSRSWDDKDGNKRFAVDIVAQVVQSLGGKSDSKPAQRRPEPQSSGDNDVPF